MKLTNLPIRALMLVLSAGGLLLTACSGLVPIPTVTPTPVPPTDTPTATIVWFPPTDTPTDFPTQPLVPTVNYQPGVADQLFSDTFDQARLWNTASSNFASAVVTRNQLILSINGQGYSVVSLRSQPVLGNFYAQATADISLCRGKDEYGMVFRASPGGDYYRFAANCNSQVALERGRSSGISPLQDWIPSGDAPPGGPAEITFGVWAVGSEMRFFLNGNYQFSVRDPVLHSGTLGFFAASGGQTPVTVSFSNLAAYSVFYVSPTATLPPTRTPRP